MSILTRHEHLNLSCPDPLLPKRHLLRSHHPHLNRRSPHIWLRMTLCGFGSWDRALEKVSGHQGRQGLPSSFHRRLMRFHVRTLLLPLLLTRNPSASDPLPCLATCLQDLSPTTHVPYSVQVEHAKVG